MGIWSGIKTGVRGYGSLLGKGAKGAVAWESWKQAGGLGAEAFQRMKLRACPRCRENALSEKNGIWHCQNINHCGVILTSEQLQAMQDAPTLDPRVLAIAKGVNVDFSKRIRGGVLASRLCWLVAGLIGMYALSWAFDARWLTAIWSMLVAIFAALQGLRYALMVQRIANPLMKGRDFVLNPHLWFV